MTYETLLIDDAGPVARVTINRADKLNALNATVIDELTAAFTALTAKGTARVVVLAGAGDKAFVAGADIAAMAAMSPAEAEHFARRGHRLGELMAAAPYPIVAEVQGFALGGGTEIALCCDLIVASERAKFGQPEVGLGVIPGFGGTVRLARRVGVGKARELIFAGHVIDAAEALAMGLVDRVVPHAELGERVKALAEQIAKNAPVAVAHAKRVLHGVENVPLGTAKELEIQAFALCFATEDQKTAMASFVRNPRELRTFVGK
ncbi:MAG: enoyl-CoA hydratase/isomerase family protein [Myxococcales bacterium]|nr:enoyl-CoA hydratase/isomerase family protein [Myxococcales bacterium]